MRTRIEILEITDYPITLADVKKELGINHDLRDKFLKGCLDRAIEYVSMNVGRAMATMEVTQVHTNDEATGVKQYNLWLHPVKEITSLVNLDTSEEFNPVLTGYLNRFITTDTRNFAINYTTAPVEFPDRYIPIIVQYISMLFDGVTDREAHLTLSGMLNQTVDTL